MSRYPFTAAKKAVFIKLSARSLLFSLVSLLLVINPLHFVFQHHAPSHTSPHLCCSHNQHDQGSPAAMSVESLKQPHKCAICKLMAIFGHSLISHGEAIRIASLEYFASDDCRIFELTARPWLQPPAVGPPSTC